MREARTKAFFFEKKNQKTFIPLPAELIWAWPITLEAHRKQKSFGSFLQKRTSCFFL
jgi:hypothetical protein